MGIANLASRSRPPSFSHIPLPGCKTKKEQSTTWSFVALFCYMWADRLSKSVLTQGCVSLYLSVCMGAWVQGQGEAMEVLRAWLMLQQREAAARGVLRALLGLVLR